MARIRTIKPEFFTSEDITSLTPLARLFYVSLWCESDRSGRLEWKPGTFKMRYFPGDNCDISAMAEELVAMGLIILYEADGKKYAEIPTFEEHQVINNREAQSIIPARVKAASTTREPRVKAEGKEGRKEGKGTSGGFEDFYQAYPNKSGRKVAESAFTKANIEDLTIVLADVAMRSKSREWTKDDGQYIPMPSTYLNQRRWEDSRGGADILKNGILPGAI